MFTLLRQRQADLIEQMDAEDADCNQLEQTYADFYVLNRLISQWNRVYAKYIRPQAEGNSKTRKGIYDNRCWLWGRRHRFFSVYNGLKKTELTRILPA